MLTAVHGVYRAGKVELQEQPANIAEDTPVIVTFIAPNDAQQPKSANTERERVADAMRAAGLLTELGPEEKARAEVSTATPDEVRAALDRVGGKPLSELIVEMRGPKE